MPWRIKKGNKIYIGSKKALTQNISNRSTFENTVRKKLLRRKRKLITTGKKVELKKVRGVILNIMGSTVEIRNENTETTTKEKEQ